MLELNYDPISLDLSRTGVVARAMRKAIQISIVVMAAAAAAALTSLSQQPARQTYRAPHMADGHPDLNGIWQAFVTANWDVQDHDAQPGPHPEIMGAYGAGPAGQSIIEGGVIPYQGWALEKKKQNFAKRATVDVSSDKRWHEIGDPELK